MKSVLWRVAKRLSYKEDARCLKVKELRRKKHIGHCTHTEESADVKVQNIFHGEVTLQVEQIVNSEQLQYCTP